VDASCGGKKELNMFDYDKWQEIFNTVRKNKLRTLLTMFGVFWGIFMLMLLMGSGNGLQNGVTEDFSGWASNAGFLWSERTTMPYDGMQPGRYIQFDNRDRIALEQEIEDIEYLAPRLNLHSWNTGNNISRADKSGSFRVNGDYPEYQHIQLVDVSDGRHINDLDIRQHRKVAVIGSYVRDVLFAKQEVPIGAYIKINGIYFQVVGVFRSKRRNEQASRDEQTIYVPFSTFQKVFNQGDNIHWFAFTAKKGSSVQQVEADMKELLKKRHRIHPDDNNALGSENLEEEFAKVNRLFNGIEVFIWIVGIGTLLAGVIGVSNIMLIIVKERTKEIGIRKSIGATPWSIIGLVMQESVFITLIAGYTGLVLGNLVLGLVSVLIDSQGVDAGMFKNPEIDLGTALLSLLILVVAGALAGLIPASKAASVNPITALHSE
jgi:putative ABC transport system permease protein